MGECNLDKIEYAELYGENSQETEDEYPSKWEILTRNANIPWRSEIPYTGENGDCVASSGRGIDHIENKPITKKLINGFLKYCELLGKSEASSIDFRI
jgi:hypothetical protein